MNSAKVIPVIRTESLFGEGTEKDPARLIAQYWDFNGRLIATEDPAFPDRESEHPQEDMSSSYQYTK